MGKVRKQLQQSGQRGISAGINQTCETQETKQPGVAEKER